ncbi:MAG: DUF3800 domain-containing protein [Thermoplasmata archaeon]|nr:DUF3800 domain-containing protein [Thermoplasmata archaeon]
MTVVIVIDESGDLGEHSTPYFAMAALVMVRPRHMASVAKMIPNDGKEHKWSNTSAQEREKLFHEMTHCSFRAVYTVVNKADHSVSHRVFGNELYEVVLRRVIADAMEVYAQYKDVKVVVDRSTFITNGRLREIAMQEATKRGLNLVKCDKQTSNQSKCVQIADYIAGSARSKYEDGDNTVDMILEKVSVARKN